MRFYFKNKNPFPIGNLTALKIGRKIARLNFKSYFTIRQNISLLQTILV